MCALPSAGSRARAAPISGSEALPLQSSMSVFRAVIRLQRLQRARSGCLRLHSGIPFDVHAAYICIGNPEHLLQMRTTCTWRSESNHAVNVAVKSITANPQVQNHVSSTCSIHTSRAGDNSDNGKSKSPQPKMHWHVQEQIAADSVAKCAHVCGSKVTRTCKTACPLQRRSDAGEQDTGSCLQGPQGRPSELQSHLPDVYRRKACPCASRRLQVLGRPAMHQYGGEWG